jgi:hypothetical protein
MNIFNTTGRPQYFKEIKIKLVLNIHRVCFTDLNQDIFGSILTTFIAIYIIFRGHIGQ